MSTGEIQAEGGSIRRVLAIGDFRLLMSAQLLSELGDWAARLAISLLIWRSTGSAALTALVLSVSLLPALGPGQWLTVASGRFPARSVLVASDIARAGLFGLLALTPNVGLALTVSFLTGLLAVPFNAQRAAILPEITGRDGLVAGVKVSQVLQDSAVIVGYLSGGVLVAVFTVPGALLFNTASFLSSAALLSRLRCPAARTVTPAEGRVGLRGGMRTLASMPMVWAAAGLSILAFAGGVAVESVVVPVSSSFTQAAMLPTALLAGTAGVSVLATLGIPSSIRGWGLLWACLALIVVPCAVMLVAFGVHGGYTPLVGVLASGLLFAAPVPANALAAGLLPTVSRAAVFSLVAGGVAAGQAVATAMAGWLFEVGSFTGLALLIAVLLAGALAVVLAARTLDRRTELPAR